MTDRLKTAIVIFMIGFLIGGNMDHAATNTGCRSAAAYVEKMVEIFGEVRRRRLAQEDGVLFDPDGQEIGVQGKLV